MNKEHSGETNSYYQRNACQAKERGRPNNYDPISLDLNEQFGLEEQDFALNFPK